MKNILIISQKSIVTKSLKQVCINRGHNVEEVEEGNEGLTAVFGKKFDLIICSLSIEGIDGVQLIKTLKVSGTVNSFTPTALITSGENVKDLFNSVDMPSKIIQKNKSIVENFESFMEELENKSTEEVKVKILYIDDDPFIQKMIKLWLSKIPNIDLSVCGSVEDTKEFLDKEFDVIVSDNILGDGSFQDVLELVQGSALKDIPILVYTGSIEKIKEDSLKKMGNIIDILPKPFEMSDFLKKIENIKKLKKS